MRTVVLGERPKELDALIAQRRATGADLYDEVWEGEYHMAPAPRHGHALLDSEVSAALRPLAKLVGLYEGGAFNLGTVDDFRVPDRGLHRTRSNAAWLATAALVVEIVSPDDESWAKLRFYAAHDVDEVVIVEPSRREVIWLRRHGESYDRVEHSTLLGIDVADVAAQIDWPPTD